MKLRPFHIVLDKGAAHYAWGGDWRNGELHCWYGRTPLADFD